MYGEGRANPRRYRGCDDDVQLDSAAVVDGAHQLGSGSVAEDRIDSNTSFEPAHDGLVLLDVPPILIVVSRDGQRTRIAAFRFPDTGAGNRCTRELYSRSVQFVEGDVHPSQDTVEFRDIS